MHRELFIASIVLIISALIFLLFASIGVMMIIRGKKRRMRQVRVRGIFMILLGLLIAGVVFWPGFSYYYIEFLWFQGLGYESLFWKLSNLPWTLFLRFGLIALVFLFANFFLAWKLCPIPGSFKRWGAGRTNTVNRILVLSIIFVSIVMGSVSIPMWDEFRRFEEREPYVHYNTKTEKEELVVDPQFGKELGYYLFTMPVRNFESIWVKALMWATLFMSIIQYDFYRRRDSQTNIYFRTRGVYHLSLLGLLVLASSILRSIINIYRLVYSENGFAFGAGYTDIHIRIPAHYIYITIIGIIAIFVIINSFLKKKYLITIPIAVWAGSYLILIWIVPYVYQYIKVSPNEPIFEHESIVRNIEFTRLGYDLNRIKVSEIVPEVANLENIQKHTNTLKNVQLWDRKATRDFLNQNQVFRPYYKFYDVDADRYYVTDPTTGKKEYRQVMITAREIDTSRLDPKSKTWVTERLTYTHGYGLCLGPVNEFTKQGEPYLWIGGIPPNTSYPELKVTRPEIYYGEVPKGYVFVNTSQPEFDYPAKEGEATKAQDRYTNYEGTGGVPLISFLRRCMFATRFRDFRIITSEYLKPESRAIFNRSVMERLKRVTPFLLFDDDPYIVIGKSGRLWWVVDVYAASKSFPYSEPYNKDFNYIRNPFKAVIDAYNGTVDFYIWDDKEIITKVYKKSFPELFKSRDQMPDGLYDHNRYPIDLTKVQADMYCTYHMDDPQGFFARADRWDIPRETYYQSKAVDEINKEGAKDDKSVRSVEQVIIPVVPSYAMISVPDKKIDEPEFVSIISFTPWPTTQRPNMVAWMVIRNDAAHYGQILVYVFPKGEPVSGPAQIESKIDTNPEMSEKLTLWNEGGSSVIRGNMLILPVDNALFYVEPIYLRDQNTKMPLLKQVVVAAGDKIAWAENFDMAMAEVFGVGQEISATTGAPVTDDPLVSAVNKVNELLAQYKAQIQSNAPESVKTFEEIKRITLELGKYQK